MMKLLSTCIAFITVLAACAGSVRGDDEHDAVKKVFTPFIKAFREADTAAMARHYAPEVIIPSQSTLLKHGLGGLTGIWKDKKVKKDRLLKAYEKAIEALGGKKGWYKRFDNLDKPDIEYMTLTADHLESGVITLAGLKPGNVLVLVLAETKTMMFAFRKDDKAAWTIIADHWN